MKRLDARTAALGLDRAKYFRMLMVADISAAGNNDQNTH